MGSFVQLRQRGGQLGAAASGGQQDKQEGAEGDNDIAGGENDGIVLDPPEAAKRGIGLTAGKIVAIDLEGIGGRGHPLGSRRNFLIHVLHGRHEIHIHQPPDFAEFGVQIIEGIIELYGQSGAIAVLQQRPDRFYVRAQIVRNRFHRLGRGGLLFFPREKVFVRVKPVNGELLLQRGEEVQGRQSLMLQRRRGFHPGVADLPEREHLHHRENKNQKDAQPDVTEGFPE